MDLLALADFNLVAANGGYGRASRVGGTPKATLSRRVMALEESLGVRLVERGPRAIRLTEEGRNLFARTERLLREIAEAGDALGAGRERPRGPLRVSAPVLLAHVALGRLAARFASAHPEVRLEVTAEDRLVDPVEEGYDIVIRINPAPDERLVGRCFLKDDLVVVAPPTLPRPAPGETDSIRAVVLSQTSPPPEWNVWEGMRRSTLKPDPVLRLSSLLMVRDAVLEGAGAALLPRFIAADDIAAGRLACWGDARDRPVAIWALHSSRRLMSGKVRAFLDALTEAFPDRSL